MTEFRQWKREFFKDFINLYKNNPCLWQREHINYRVREKREAAYEVLLQKLRTVDPEAEVESVRNKINSLRTTFRKELTKACNAKKAGETYIPSLWYWQQLSFLLTSEEREILGSTEGEETEIELQYSGNEENLVECHGVSEDASLHTLDSRDARGGDSDAYKMDFKTCYMRDWPHEFFTEFLELYKENPCLWKTDCKDYNNRQVKESSYLILLQKYRQIEPYAKMENVKNKINSIRTAFRREIVKVQKAIESGEHYLPSLWYFDLLLFLLPEHQQKLLRSAQVQCEDKFDDPLTQELYTEHGTEGNDKVRTSILIMTTDSVQNSFENTIDNDAEMSPHSALVADAASEQTNGLTNEQQFKLWSLREWSREFFVEFIQLYKDRPCLWKTDSKDYNNRRIKHRAYLELLKKVREVEPAANINTIKSKINNIRTTFRSEVRKEEKSRQLGETYIPRLWYYDLLTFVLNNPDQKDQEQNKINSRYEHIEAMDIDELTESDKEENLQEDPFALIECSSGVDIKETYSSNHTNKKRKMHDKAIQTRRLQIFAEDGANGLRISDSFDVFGKHVAMKLKGLKRVQNIFAQKLINEVLFGGEMEFLNSSVKILNVKRH